MGDLYLAEQSYPSTPASGNQVIWADSTAPVLCTKDDAGRVYARSHNASVANQGAGFATDTYVTDSDILIPSFGMQARTVIRWVIAASKTAAGTAAPIYSIRIGSARTTADTARLQLTGDAQTAAVDEGLLEIVTTVRTVSATGVIRGAAGWKHNSATAGFASTAAGMANTASASSAGFDNSALGGQYIGLSINGGTSAAWTLAQVIAEAIW